MQQMGILFISYHFQTNSGGNQRISKFFDALDADENYNVFLITLYTKNKSNLKNTYYSYDLIASFKKMFYSQNKTENTINENLTIASFPKEKSLFYRLKSSLKKALYLFFCFPDEHSTFILFGLLKGIYVLCRNKISYIFSTYPPTSNLIVGHLLSICFRKRHIVDLREPWGDFPDWTMKFDDTSFLVKLRLRVENFIEQKIVKNAYKVILNSKRQKDYYFNKYGNANYTVITNGYDDETIKSISEKNTDKSSKDINIIYTGSYYLKYQPDSLLIALKELIDHQPELQKRICFNIYGSIDGITKQIISDYSSIINIKYHGYKPKEVVFQKIIESDIGVISIPSIDWAKYRIPGKMYEYLKLGIPLLIICPKDSALFLLANELNYTCFWNDETSRIGAFISKVISTKDNKGMISDVHDPIQIEKYNYTKLISAFKSLFASGRTL